MTDRTIAGIATEIVKLWKLPLAGHHAQYQRFAAEQLPAMLSLDTRSCDAPFGCDTAYSVLATFLGNVGPWRGPDARRIKSELRAIMATGE